MRRFVIDIDFSTSDIVRYRETFQQEFYPVFYEEEDAHGISLGYGNKETPHSEFLDIYIDLSASTVTVERDLKATLILFTYFYDGRLIISSDYNYFAQQLDLRNSLNEDFLKSLLGNGRIARGSICKHISVLYPRHRYVFSDSGLHKEEIPYKSKTIHIDDILHQNFCNLTEKNTVAAEISGGKDSAFLPILSKKSHFFPFQLVTGQLHTGVTGEQQRETVSCIIDFMEIPHEYYTITSDDYPLKNEPVGHIQHPVEEIYKNSLLGQIQIMKKHGINTVFNGFGGDESFEDREDLSNTHTPKSDDFLRVLFSQQLIDDVRALNNDEATLYTDSIFQTSVYDALISRNNIYIHNGIRPITPYLNIDTYHYFQSLQISKDKFFTAFYENFDPSLAGCFSKNTNMANYFMEYFRSEFFNNLLQSCVTQESPLHKFYNIVSIKQTFLKTSEVSDDMLDKYDFLLYLFVKMSLMLR